jgi:hypothetical protein
MSKRGRLRTADPLEDLQDAPLRPLLGSFRRSGSKEHITSKSEILRMTSVKTKCSPVTERYRWLFRRQTATASGKSRSSRIIDSNSILAKSLFGQWRKLAST